VYYINSSDGSIIWTLAAGGKSNFATQEFNFSFQHDARIRMENDTHTLLTLYDNGSNGFNKTSDYSSGMIILLDHNAGSANLIKSYWAPIPGAIKSDSQGNMQLLDSGYVFQGYGSVDAISEHKPDGTPVFFAQFGAYPVMNYRAFTSQWQGYPTTRPSLYSYAKNLTAPNTLYASWNGATEVATWRFWGGDSANGDFEMLGDAQKVGFETGFTANGFSAYVFVEAMGADGTSWRNSTIQKTYVPSGALASACDDVQCPLATAYGGVP
jgi:hypothetical protein